MSEIGKVPTPAAPGDATRRVAAVNPDGGGRPDEQHQGGRQDAKPRGSEELALALSDEGHASVEARLEQDDAGAAVIRVVDRDSGETIAVVTPEELRELAEQTGLPTGMLLQAES